MPAGDGEPARRHDASVMAITEDEALPQDRLHVGGEGRARMIGGNEPTAPQQMRETGLMRGGGEAPIRRPAIADEHAPLIKYV